MEKINVKPCSLQRKRLKIVSLANLKLTHGKNIFEKEIITEIFDGRKPREEVKRIEHLEAKISQDG